MYYSPTSAVTLFHLCFVFFYSAHLLMELALLPGERRCSLSRLSAGYIREWVESLPESRQRRYVKNLPQGYCLLPETEMGRERAQKQTNFSIKRRGGSLFLFFIYFLFFPFFISDISYQAADGTIPSPQIWGKTIYRSQIELIIPRCKKLII